MRSHLLRSFVAVLGCLGLALAAAPAQAAPYVSFNGWQPGEVALGCSSTGGPITTCVGTNASPGSNNFTVTSWNLFLDSDPVVSNFISIQNNLLTAQTFTITVQIPIAPSIGSPITIQGSVGGSITDFNGNGATLTKPTGAIYTALVDGLPVQTLLNAPQTVTAGVFGSQTFGPASFGPLAYAAPAVSDIGITMSFTLSPGDLVSYTSVFVVTPEPGTLLLVGSGIAGLVAYGRRTRLS